MATGGLMKYFALVFVLTFFLAVFNFYTYDQHKAEKCARKDSSNYIFKHNIRKTATNIQFN